ncbi:fam-a protein [Plasmodium vinckei vinckei]|uniref:Fam-a protein n=1 Tax=Plasmodium vinckei vinckei TaxID=54757 RepID=A0A449BM84_PLAVN|nr:fam-a protein [Plasmodium vinckei vinckei]VEV54561.1 fam-a protein [Plasmodium vinckei vinckei]
MNKRYIKIALTLLSVAGYMQNVAFASETDEQSCTANSSLRHKPSSVYQQYKDETNNNFFEGLEAAHYSKNSKDILKKLADADVQNYTDYPLENENTLYNKKIRNMDIGRLDITIPSSSKYNTIINQYWDFKYDKNPDEKIINGKVVRLYCEGGVIFEKPNTYPNNTPLKKIYTLGSRIYRKEMTVIVCPSRILNYDGEINKGTDLETLYKSHKLIQTNIDPVEALNKYADNIAGFVIKKDEDNDQVHLTYINAIYDNGNSTEYAYNKRQRDHEYTKILKLAKRIMANEFDYPPRKGV